MPALATKAQQLAQEHLSRLEDLSEPIDELTLRRIIRLANAALDDASSAERGLLFSLLGLAHNRLGSVDKALDAFRNGARCEPSTSSHLNNAAACLVELGRLDEALDLMRLARSKPDAKEMIATILGNEAEVLHKLGAKIEARATLLDAASRAAPHDHTALFSVAMQAAVIGCDDTAVEFFARFLAAVQQVELGETPAVEFIRAAPEEHKVGMRSRAPLAAAIERATKRYDETSPGEGQLDANVALSPEAWEKVEALLADPPAPTEALRGLLHGRRA